ncbi:unnamed protein product [Cyprideis torosa]|uniref:EamA domain-containing protein n=1 Tax=Cyprideis torosa TaxID=163714 RepID=A0A7R8WUB7_9CRUS|nr:unnamed protein product [Cyprideis torosa]CAG0910433.1 unnamed protein product [Cyprideis torosa]
MVIFLGLVSLQGRISLMRGALGTSRAIAATIFASLMISANWFLFIFSVQIGRVTETSLGYYIFPLLAVVLGVLVFKERLSKVQWLAVMLAAIGVSVLGTGQASVPWISLILALTFGLYGLVKKRLSVGPVISVTAEVVVLSPLAIGWLCYLHYNGNGVFGQDLRTSALLAFSGLLTAVPLILFSRAAQKVRLATVGLLQYINPTLQFICATVIFKEPFGTVQAITFGCIWVALAIYSASSLYQDKARRKRAMTSVAEVPD